VLTQLIEAIEVLRVAFDPQLRGKPVRRRSCPATVSGEPLSNKVTEARKGFGKTGQQQ
jgi:hypothetical protein